MYARAFNAKDDTKVDGDPLYLLVRVAVGAPRVTLVNSANLFKKASRILIVGAAA